MLGGGNAFFFRALSFIDKEEKNHCENYSTMLSFPDEKFLVDKSEDIVNLLVRGCEERERKDNDIDIYICRR